MTDWVTDVLLVAAGLTLLEGIFSLRGGIRFLNSCRRSVVPLPGSRLPQVSLIIPCKGVDPGLEKNLIAYFKLQYPNLQLLLVTADRSDPALNVINDVVRKFPEAPARILVACQARNRGQKIENLDYALKFLRTGDEVIAFGDSDIRPDSRWLLHLVRRLEEENTAVSTGFRWYLPQQRSFASILRSAWNAGIVSMMSVADSSFAWGGAMAIRVETFRRCRVAEYWQNALSDDYALSRAVRDHGLRIRFEPRCLSFSYEDCTLKELLQWSFRQLAITRVYSPGLWWTAFWAQSITTITFWAGMVACLAGVAGGNPDGKLQIAGGLLLAYYLLGSLKSWLRLQAVADLFPGMREALMRFRVPLILLGPVTALVSVIGLYRSLWSQEIEWRGIRYRMNSPRSTEIVARRGG